MNFWSVLMSNKEKRAVIVVPGRNDMDWEHYDDEVGEVKDAVKDFARDFGFEDHEVHCCLLSKWHYDPDEMEVYARRN